MGNLILQGFVGQNKELGFHAEGSQESLEGFIDWGWGGYAMTCVLNGSF